MKKFNVPTQCLFVDPYSDGKEKPSFLSGIAFGDQVICACCGGVFEIDDLEEVASEYGMEQAIFPYHEWIDLTDEIIGDELPDGFYIEDFETGLE